MKELSIGQKAKAYDEAIDKVAHFIKKHIGFGRMIHPNSLEAKELFNIFPELKESDDERIRKVLIGWINLEPSTSFNDTFDGFSKEQILAWLEKQGEQKSYGQRDECMDCQFNYAGECKGSCAMKRGEQKPADKVEPKFKVGDVIRLKDGDGLEWTVENVHKNGYYTIVNSDRDDFIYLDDNWEIINQKVEPKFHKGEWIVWQDKCYKVNYNGCGYELVDQNGLSTSLEYGTIDENAHLWDITKDAKDGDVLVYGDNSNDHHVEVIMIFKSLKNERFAFTHFHIFDDSFRIDDWCDCGENVHPATKEQRDLLFQRMNEAGYEWDAEKKELKKIVAPIFHIGDRVRYKGYSCDGVITEITDTDYICGDAKLPISTQDKLELIEQKPTWSEEDENMRYKAVAVLNRACAFNDDFVFSHDTLVKIFNWLKSLKDRVQLQNKWKESLATADLENSLCDIQDRFSDTSYEYRILGEAIEFIRCTESKPQWKPSDEQMEIFRDLIEDNNQRFFYSTLKSLYNDLKKLKE